MRIVQGCYVMQHVVRTVIEPEVEQVSVYKCLSGSYSIAT